jgi:hypothetical protein
MKVKQLLEKLEIRIYPFQIHWQTYTTDAIMQVWFSA